MHKRQWGFVVRLMVVAGLVAVWAGSARAAGEWEWTKDQGWTMGAGVSRPTAKEQLHYAYELEQRGEFMDSARQYFLLIQNFPDSEEAGIGLQRMAKCLFEMENYYTSYRAIEQVIQTYPHTGRMGDLVEIELRIAKKMMVTETPDLFGGSGDNSRAGNIRRALDIVNSVIEHDPYGPVAAEAHLVKGEGNLFIGEINTARAAFEIVRDEFPRSDFVERARLGILRCDSLMGQARPQEVYEQVQVVREAEAERQKAGRAGDDELDDVEESLRQLAEVEAAKMMEQAEQYRRMGTRASVQSSQFLYKEIARRYPGTPQADEANEKLGNVKLPQEQSRIAKSIKSININPFTWNKDKEPPWIVPQIDPEDMVMVDDGLGPIIGVPETGMPSSSGAPGVRPAALDTTASAALAPEAGAAGFSPASAAPSGGTPAPSYVDGTRGGAAPTDFYAAAPAPIPSMPNAPSSPVITSPNPLPAISEADLISLDGSAGMGPLASSGGYGGNVPMPGYSGTPAPAPYGAPQTAPMLPDMGPSSAGAMNEPPRLGRWCMTRCRIWWGRRGVRMRLRRRRRCRISPGTVVIRSRRCSNSRMRTLMPPSRHMSIRMRRSMPRSLRMRILLRRRQRRRAVIPRVKRRAAGPLGMTSDKKGLIFPRALRIMNGSE